MIGIKTKSFDDIEFGIYCQPIGILKDEFGKNQPQFEIDKNKDIWYQYQKRGNKLFHFQKNHTKFKSIYAKRIFDIPLFKKI